MDRQAALIFAEMLNMGWKRFPLYDPDLLPERFRSKFTIDPVSHCWVWEAGVDPDGYGYYSEEGRRKAAHRYCYLSLVGPIPDRHGLDHLCRFRRCVNPSHLEPVTTKDNVLRGVGVAAMNAEKTHCVKGHPLSGDNLYTRGDGGRICRECNRIAALAYYHRKKGKK